PGCKLWSGLVFWYNCFNLHFLESTTMLCFISGKCFDIMHTHKLSLSLTHTHTHTHTSEHTHTHTHTHLTHVQKTKQTDFYLLHSCCQILNKEFPKVVQGLQLLG